MLHGHNLGSSQEFSMLKIRVKISGKNQRLFLGLYSVTFHNIFSPLALSKAVSLLMSLMGSGDVFPLVDHQMNLKRYLWNLN